MKKEPRVSVIIPVYNQRRELKKALNSIQNQSFDALEVIVVDDSSDMEISPIVSEYGDWVRLVVHEENRGAAQARNTGIEAARTDYVAFLDADDVWTPNKIAKQYDAFNQSNEELGLVYTGFVQYETDGSEWIRRPRAKGNIYVDELERDQVHPTSTVMVRRECLERVGGFDPSLPSRQDYDLWIRITEHYEVDYVDDVLVKKFEQEDSISKNFDSRIEGDRAVLEKVRGRIDEFDFWTRSRVLSYHYHVLGRDYESNGDRGNAMKYLSLAILRYPFRPVSWAMLAITILGIDRNGRLMKWVKNQIR